MPLAQPPTLPLTVIPHPVLAQPCERVVASALKSGAYTKLLEEMRVAMKEHVGIGLAANQVGNNLALFVIDPTLAKEAGVSDAFANPEITEYGKETEGLEEGCLSIPGFWTPVQRSKKIMFKALDATTGLKVKFRARGMLARVLQHETDHLYGTTIKDRATKKRARRPL